MFADITMPDVKQVNAAPTIVQNSDEPITKNRKQITTPALTQCIETIYNLL